MFDDVTSWTPAEGLPPRVPALEQALMSQATLDRYFALFCDYAANVNGCSPATIRSYRDAYRNF